jgi:hypothetical protein
MAVIISDLVKDGQDDLILAEVRLHLSAAGGAGNFTITLGSAKSPNGEYDCVLSGTPVDMTAVTDKVLQPYNIIGPRDRLTLAWANASGRTWGLELIFRPANNLD